nr:segment polarity protein dishevelled homolog DVL-3-like isoform X3 [Dermatophagoides farinae]
MLISKPNHSMLKNSGSSAIADSDATILDSNGVAIIDSTVDQSIANNSQTSPPPISTNNGQQLPLKVGPLASTNETRIVYHVDDEETPYLVKLPIPHSQIKLSDFKSAISLPRPHYKYFFKSYDKEVGVVKEEIFDDNASLPIFKDRVVAWLVSTEGSVVSDSTNSQCQTEISATARTVHATHHHHHAHQRQQECNGLIGDSHLSSFNDPSPMENESLLNSRDGHHHHHHLSPRRGYNNNKNSHNNKYSGGRYGNSGGYYHGHHHRHHGHHHGNYMDSSVMTSDIESTSFVDSEDDDDDDDDLLNDTTVDDENDYEDYTSRVSTTTEETSVSRQYQRRNRHRNRRQKGGYRNRMSRTSSLSSITESSMSLNIIQVILNLDTVNYLGISLVGQTSKKGDGGIYVSSILKGGAVALDGRIEPGDMILQVNDINLENLSNDEAVEVIREAVKKPGPIKLLVAKCWDPHPLGHFTIPRSEPVRPIDPEAWVAHTEAARAKFTHPDNFPLNLAGSGNFMRMNPTPVDSERNPMFQPSTQSFNPSNVYPLLANGGSVVTGGDTNSGLVPGCSLRSSFKSGHSTITTIQQPQVTASSCLPLSSSSIPISLARGSDLKTIACAMASPNSGLDVRDRMWLKISIPNAFLGSDVVDWLYSMISGLHDRKDAKKMATKLLKEGYICHTINFKNSLSEKCYYIFSEQLNQINKATTDSLSTSDFQSHSVLSQPISASAAAGGHHQVHYPLLQQQPSSLPNNFEDNFGQALRLKNEFDSDSQQQQQLSANFDVINNRSGRSKFPFMCHWDEKSEIYNYGLLDPQPMTMKNNDSTMQINHSGGNHSSYQDHHHIDEQNSQTSGQSILYNGQAVMGKSVNTVKNSGSYGCNNQTTTHTLASKHSNGSSNDSDGITGKFDLSNRITSSNNNLINHHYEDLQINPVTGNLVPTSTLVVNNANLSDNKALLQPTNGSNITDNPYIHRHIEGNELGVINVSDSNGQTGRHHVLNHAPTQSSSRGSSIASSNGASKLANTANVMRSSFKKTINKS